MSIKREDTVQILAGKDKGKRGKVQAILKKDGLILVEGVNMIKKHTRQRPVSYTHLTLPTSDLV